MGAMTCFGLVVAAWHPYLSDMAGVAAVAQDVRVLIVDDEDDMRALLRATLELADARLSVAAEAVDGEDAVAKWREARPDVVVIDQRMPHTSGLEAAKRIRECKELCKSAPILAITAFDTYGMEEAALEAGCNGYIRKPLDTEEAERTLRSFIPW